MGSHHLPRDKKLHIPWGGLWPARMSKVGGITHQSPPSRMLKPGWIGRPAKWICLIGGQNLLPFWVEDPWKLAQKICASFSILAVRSKVFLGQGYTAPPASMCLTWNVFSQMNCPMRMCDSSLSS